MGGRGGFSHLECLVEWVIPFRIRAACLSNSGGYSCCIDTRYLVVGEVRA